MFGSLALVAVWQEQREARYLPPLGEPGDEKRIDDDLGAGGKVAVLRFPQHQRIGRRRGVPVLEAEAGEPREQAVAPLERRPRAGLGLDRRVTLPAPGAVRHSLARVQRPPL